MCRNISRFVVLIVASTTLLSACALPTLARPQPTPAIPIDLPLRTQNQLRDFDTAVKSVRDNYLNSEALGPNWQAAVATYRERVVKGVDDQMYYDILEELLATLGDDDLTFIRPVAQANASATSTLTSTAGIGVLVSLPERDRERLLVMGVYPQSPADDAGIRPHDAIVKIDGQPVTYAERDTVTSRVRGPGGTEVTLTIRTPGKGEREVTITRGAIQATSLMLAQRVPDSNIGYIRPDFTDAEGMHLTVAQALRDLSRDQPVDGLVIDLRAAQYASFPLEEMLSLFANGPMGHLYTRSGKTEIEVRGKNIAGSQEVPMMLLVGDQTRGAAESFAGILQALGRARIVGAQPPGRNTLQIPVVLSNTGGQLLIPAGEYRGIKDISWYRVGIHPDIVSDLLWEQFTEEDDPQLDQAVEALTQ